MFKSIPFSIFPLFILLLTSVCCPRLYAQLGDTCGVTPKLIHIRMDTIDKVPLCVYRVEILNNRDDVARVVITPQGSTVIWNANATGSTTTASVTNISGEWHFLPIHSVYPNLSTTYTIGQIWVRGPAPQRFTFSFINSHSNTICKINREEKCGTQIQDTTPNDPCLVRSITINTGYNPLTNTTIPFGDFDPYWTVVSDPIPTTIEPRPAIAISKHPSWANPLPNSQWISSNTGFPSQKEGQYVFKRCFCVKNETRALVDLLARADDIIDSLFVCGQKIEPTMDSVRPHWFLEPPIKFNGVVSLRPDTCCIEVYVRDTLRVAYGLNIAGSITQLTNPDIPTLIHDSCCGRYGWIVGRKYYDVNCNGRIDYGEPPLPGWTINATNTTTGVTYTATTGTNGWYQIQVPPGNYIINEVLQPNFTQSSGGPYFATINPGEVVHFNFLNCKVQEPPCDTIGTIDLFDTTTCCEFNIPIYQPTSIACVSNISWTLVGGTAISITPPLSCPSTLIPTNPFGTTTGTIVFSSPGCTANPLNLGMSVYPTGHSVTLYLTIYHCNQRVCYDTLVLSCFAPLVRCDSLSVEPFSFGDLQLSGRTFTIFNLKQPPSPIKEILIQFNPPPCSTTVTPQGDWNGGGLVVDGGGRSWGITNSGTPKYSRINMNCSPLTGAPQGPAANSYVKFNLGIDTTCGWIGDVTFLIIHCDGDTCKETYSNWIARGRGNTYDTVVHRLPDPISLDLMRAIEVSIDSSLVPGTEKRFACFATVVPKSPGWDVIGVSIEDDLTKEERESAKFKSWQGNVKLLKAGSTRTGYLELQNTKWEPKPIKKPWILRAILATREETPDSPFVEITFYDANSNPIATGEAKASVPVSSVPVDIISPNHNSSDRILRIVPNPATDNVRVDYVLTSHSDVVLEILDNLGQQLIEFKTSNIEPGVQSAFMSTGEIPAGSYFVRLRTSRGISVAPLKIIR